MALPRRDLIPGINSLASGVISELDSVPGLTATSTNEQATATSSADSTTSSGQAASAATSISSSTLKSTKSALPSTISITSSTITSSSYVASTTSSGSSSGSTSSINSTTPTSTIATSTTSTLAHSVSSATSIPSASLSDSNGNSISTAGIAVAAVFGTLILAAFAYLLWKYLPAARNYRERKYEQRSHRKGLSLDNEEGMHFDDPKQGLGLRRFSFHTAPTYYPGQAQEREDLAKRPLTSASDEHIVSPMSMRSMGSISQHTLPSALQSGPTSYMPYREVRASAIGVAVPLRSSEPMDKGLPPLPSNGYVRPSS